MFIAMQLPIGNPRTWWTAILVGLFLLTLALVVLARLRWIQSRPFATCIVLSVFAHVLLIATVWLSRVFDEVPRPPGPVAMRVTVVQPVEPPQRAIAQPKPPWEQLASDVPSETLPDEPPRAQVDLTPDVARLPAELPDLVDNETPLTPHPKTIRPLPQPPAPDTFPTPDVSEVVPESLVAPAPALLNVVATPLTAPEADVEEESPRPEEPVEAEPNEVVSDPQDVADQPPVPPTAVDVDERAAINGWKAESGDVAGDEVPLVSDDLGDHERQREPRDLQVVTDGSQADEESWSSIGAAELFPVAPAENARLNRNTSLPWRAVEDRDQETAHSIPARRMDGSQLPREYKVRTRADRLQVARPRGANKHSELAVKAALVWLARNQADDGRWDPRLHGAGRGQGTDPQSQSGAGRAADTGLTGLALLAFLGAGHTHVDGKHKQTVQAGLDFLLRQQAADGNLAGRAGTYERMYCHGMATLALSEAVAMTGDRRLRPFLQRAIDYTVRSQNSSTGGWRYFPGDRGDTSQLGWQLMCVATAQSSGVSVPASTRRGMERFLASVSYGRGALAAYRPGERTTRSMTAEALVCRLFLDGPPPLAAVEEAVAFIMQEMPGQASVNYYYWYYGTLALSLLDDEDWPVWNRALQRQLLSRQRQDDPYAGSWEPDSRWGAYGGRVYTTSLATLCLEVYYRYAPQEQDGIARRQSATGRH